MKLHGNKILTKPWKSWLKIEKSYTSSREVLLYLRVKMLYCKDLQLPFAFQTKLPVLPDEESVRRAQWYEAQGKRVPMVKNGTDRNVLCCRSFPSLLKSPLHNTTESTISFPATHTFTTTSFSHWTQPFRCTFTYTALILARLCKFTSLLKYFPCQKRLTNENRSLATYQRRKTSFEDTENHVRMWQQSNRDFINLMAVYRFIGAAENRKCYSVWACMPVDKRPSCSSSQCLLWTYSLLVEMDDQV